MTATAKFHGLSRVGTGQITACLFDGARLMLKVDGNGFLKRQDKILGTVSFGKAQARNIFRMCTSFTTGVFLVGNLIGVIQGSLKAALVCQMVAAALCVVFWGASLIAAALIFLPAVLCFIHASIARRLRPSPIGKGDLRDDWLDGPGIL